jgi:predicted transcriptional regulator
MRQRLSRHERQVMFRVYARGRATAEEIREDLVDEVPGTAIGDMLAVLEHKGFLVRRSLGFRAVYFPVQTGYAAA